MYRFSPAGKVCSGDFLKDKDNLLYGSQKYVGQYYLIGEGRMLMIAPIIQLIMKPLLCCLQVHCTTRILEMIRKEREIILRGDNLMISEFMQPSPFPRAAHNLASKDSWASM